MVNFCSLFCAGAKPRRLHPPILDTDSAICDEFAEIERRRLKAGAAVAPCTDPVGETVAVRARRLELTALCLSGGGVRSASFCLGVMQALAAKHLLNQFDYLSTVSGGGFIGGWLQMLLADSRNVEEAQDEIGALGTGPVQRLRGYTNYLSPQTGPFSADTWAGIVLYVRNLLLNWMVFAPLILLLAMAPTFYRTLLGSLYDESEANAGLLAIAGLALVVAAWQGCALVPSHRAGSRGFAGSRDITWRIIAPALIWAWLVPAVIDYGLEPPPPFNRALRVADWAPQAEWVIPAVYTLAMTIGYCMAWLPRTGGRTVAHDLYAKNCWRWVIATVCAAGFAWLGLHLICHGGSLRGWAVQNFLSGTDRLLVNNETAVSVLLPLWLIGTHALQTTFYVAFRKEGLLTDLDREWQARLSGGLLRVGVAWAVLAACCLVLPPLVALGQQVTQSGWMGGAVVGTTTLGGIVAWLGRRLSAQIETLAGKSKRWQGWVLGGFSILFGIGLLVIASDLLQYNLGIMQQFVQSLFNVEAKLWQLLVLHAVILVVLSALIVCFGRVNVNRFSMHAVYRNRLTRAFLGAGRDQRRPDLFTGFDPDDNPRLADFARPETGQRLFPVINMTLNVTSSQNAAWAERKAESFVCTPLACGAGALRHPDADHLPGHPPHGAFVATTAYAGQDSLGDERGKGKGVRIGTVLTISGAAVSPNWGYHSSRLTAFLMTLFNVRLGAWLPNPAIATPSELQLAKPKNSVTALVNELLGASTDCEQAIYLSDGGHFENLGVYEMLRRRCRRIIVVDAGQDGDCSMFDLGNMIRKSAIDLRVIVEMQPMRIYPRTLIEEDDAVAAKALGVACGLVTYPEDPDGKDPALLVYLKPSFLSDIPADVRSYGQSDESFPHDSTLDQWFTESQFESYRALGAWQMNQVIGASKDSRCLQEVLQAAVRMCA
jgi:hypothetical protein